MVVVATDAYNKYAHGTNARGRTVIPFYRIQLVSLNLAAVDPSVVESQNEQLAVHPQYREILVQLAPPVVLVVTSTRDVQR